MKKYFLMGVVSILPIILTLKIVKFFINLLTIPFLELILNFTSPFDSFLKLFILQTGIIIFLFSFILFVGFLGQMFLINICIGFFNNFMHKIPFANKIYKAMQELMNQFFAQEKSSFTKTVIVPYPHKESKALGFIAQENLTLPFEGEFSSVYVVGAPNPMMGFILILPKNKISNLSVSVNEAAKFTFSCGMLKLNNY